MNSAKFNMTEKPNLSRVSSEKAEKNKNRTNENSVFTTYNDSNVDGTQLENGRTLADYSVQKKSTLHRMQIKEDPATSKNKTLTAEATSKDTSEGWNDATLKKGSNISPTNRISQNLACLAPSESVKDLEQRNDPGNKAVNAKKGKMFDLSFQNFSESAPVKAEFVSARFLDEPDVNLSKQSRKRLYEEMSDQGSMIVDPKQKIFMNMSFDKSSVPEPVNTGLSDEPSTRNLRLEPQVKPLSDEMNSPGNKAMNPINRNILDSSFENLCESAPVKVECVSAKLLDEPDVNLSKESKKRPSEEMSNPVSMIVNPKQNKFLSLSFDKSSASVPVKAGLRDEPDVNITKIKPSKKSTSEKMSDIENNAMNKKKRKTFDSSPEKLSESAPFKAEFVSDRILDEPDVNLSKQSRKRLHEEMSDQSSMIVDPKQKIFLNMSFDKSSASVPVNDGLSDEPSAKNLRPEPPIKPPSEEMSNPGNKAVNPINRNILDSSFENFSESAPVKVECVSAKLLDEPDVNLSKESKKRPSEDMSDPDSMIVNPKQNKFLNLSFDKSSASVLITGVRDEWEKKPFEPKGVKHVACVVGVEAYNIKKKIAELCGWKKLSTFPGGQPVSLTQDNIEFLKKFKYQVTWRADGTRFMMLIQGEKTYLCDRDYKIYEVSAKFYSNKMCLLKDTLLDGVLVLDKWKNKKSGLEESRYNFLIYDIISYDGKNIGSSPFNIRLDCIQDDIIEPRTRAKKKDLIKTGSESFRITKKEYFKLEDSHKVFRGGSFFKQLTHDTDGLIFQPVDESYKCGQWSKLLKWKQVNTADFRLKIEEVREYGQLPRQYGSLLVSENGEEVNFLQNSVKLERLLIWKNYDGKIIECCFDKGESIWKFVRERFDKSFPNSKQTVESVMHCIKNPVSEEYLKRFIQKTVKVSK
ncbi:uncharacterized protein LOC136035593 [Artemia franciscana]|uniref:mRNA guanylyltransferase n=1 Tax=Artemia franciscana TaxID=6661 RepID=A0AA88L7S0_ARTSF|nr:hypothetical protein QYM36_003724 [Artemia franciscana]